MTLADAQPIVLGLEEAGEFQVPTDMLAERFGWTAQTFHNMIGRGLVASRVERGEGEDAGRWRLTVRCGNRRWQAIVEQDGTVSAQRIEVIPFAPSKSA